MNHDLEEDYDLPVTIVHHGEMDPNDVVYVPLALCRDWRLTDDAGRLALYVYALPIDEELDMGAVAEELGITDLSAALACLRGAGWIVWQPYASPDSDPDDGQWHLADPVPFTPAQVAELSTPVSGR